MKDASSKFDRLADRLVKDKDIDQFQFYEETKSVLKSGFNSDGLGGIYQPIQNHTHSRISFLITTKNNRQSKGSFNPFVIQDIDDSLKFIKQTSFECTDSIKLAPVFKDFTPLKLSSNKLEDIITSKPEEIVSYTKQLFDDQKSLGLKTIESQVSMRSTKKRFVSSNGNDLHSSTTSHEYYIEYNGEISTQNEACEYISTKEFSKTRQTAQLAKSLTKSPATLKSGKLPVIISPDYTSSILDKYVLENINGNLVESGVSRYEVNDFTSARQIARNDINIAVDQTVPMSTDSFDFTTEGIAGQKFEILKNGKLTAPICDLQTATKLGLTARYLPTLSSASYKCSSFGDFKSTNPKFVLILSVLGIHTQNAVNGNYSLPCPSALYFENGKLVGPINCVLIGDFFDKLNDESLDFVKHPAFKKPMMSFDSEIQIK